MAEIKLNNLKSIDEAKAAKYDGSQLTEQADKDLFDNPILSPGGSTDKTKLVAAALLCRAKYMKPQNYHQEIVRKVSSNYTEGFYDDYETPRGSRGLGAKQKQEEITLSAYETETTYDFLYGALEWLELYVEKANY
ncbi:MAG: hypothetical protein MRERC_1c001 [Mycoplasmataceae bacterium RC_NB112A]|nr:MAG: hypothetical protein MRERC_9c060 [Mycoplasmataceae bacterium RC_NB112A]KLL02430.1 MAG: hypothetical protein MRERC_1c001 [Mycoplasmataceae bacterium RC_NB112A]